MKINFSKQKLPQSCVNPARILRGLCDEYCIFLTSSPLSSWEEKSKRFVFGSSLIVRNEVRDLQEGDMSDVITLDQPTSLFSPPKAIRMSP